MVNIFGAVIKTQTSQSKLNFSHQKVKSKENRPKTKMIEIVIFPSNMFYQVDPPVI